MEDQLLKKMRFKAGRAAVLNPPEGYFLGVEDEGDLEGKYEFVQLFVSSAQEVEEWLPKAIPLLNGDALFWLTYPKQSAKVKTDINRDVLAARVQKLSSYRVVSNVAVDEKWSALRLRLQDKVKAGK